ncbi:MAG TPA: M15 family metallopeptidase [Pyrinomonadaceae bacterium]|jgi:hypothetical protein
MKERTRFEDELLTLTGVNGSASPNYETQNVFFEPVRRNEVDTDFPVYREREIDPKLGKSLYLPIQLGKTVMPKIGVFIPSGFIPSPAVNIIVYFHGNIIADCKTDETKFKKQGIQDYWNTPLFECLRKDLALSNRNAILIAPTLSTFFGNSSKYPSTFIGELDIHGKFDFLIGECLKELKLANEIPNDAQPNHIILAGHSAGGRPMQSILEAKNVLEPKIKECWGFECLYFGTCIWTIWLRKNPDKKFVHYRRKSKFSNPTGELKKFGNFIDASSGKSHCGLLAQKWREAIDNCQWLQNSPQNVTPVQSNRNYETGSPDSPGTFVEIDLLKDKPLSASRVLLGAKRQGKKYVKIVESPSIYVPEILRMAAEKAREEKKDDIAAKLDPTKYFQQFTEKVYLPNGETRPLAFLGRELTSDQPIHVEMATLLQKTEDKFVKDLNKTPAEAGDILLLKSKETIRGWRAISSTADYSYHLFGLAADINYKGNPFIESKEDVKALNKVLNNAASLMKRAALTYKKDMKAKIKDRFDFLRELDSLLEQYFALLDDETKLEQFRADSNEWKLRSLAEAKTRIQNDLNWLSGMLERGDTKKYKRKDYFKKNAILNFDKTFVVAMEQNGFFWGGRYGDMMHFDMRYTGVGNYITQAIAKYKININNLIKSLLDKKTYGTYTADGRLI